MKSLTQLAVALSLSSSLLCSLDSHAQNKQGAYFTQEYPNLFTRLGKSQQDVDKKLSKAWKTYFEPGDPNRQLFYPFDDDEGYILDVASNDIRSEGMSYGMMIAVQMDKQATFDKLWRFARTRMMHQQGPREGYFCWQADTQGKCMDPGSAPDGEEYFAMALYFAAHRWGNGEGILNYKAEADELLREMLHQEKDNGGVVENVHNMFNPEHNMVVFSPEGDASKFSDPSYHLPAFYELFSQWGPQQDQQRWQTIRDVSRNYFYKTVNIETCMAPEYANFDGTGHNGWADGGWNDNRKVQHRGDAWRVAMNWSLDYSWFGADENQQLLSNCILAFFVNPERSGGIDGYMQYYHLDGRKAEGENWPKSVGQVAMHATTVLAADAKLNWPMLFVNDFWNAPMPSGKYRYYEGMLYLLGILAVSGEYQIYGPQ